MKELLTHISDRLNKRYSSGELEAIVATLCLDYLEIPQIKFYLKEKIELSPVCRQKLETALIRLEKGEPLQYVMGYTSFCGLRFKVDNSVLIPRPETAELVEWVLQTTKDEPSILDVGTGSGCIAVTLAKRLPGAKVDACDISSDALNVAYENSLVNGSKVLFHKRDILTDRNIDKKYDIIVSNPPYITEIEKKDMDDTVLNYEPHTALFVNNPNPLLFYNAIADFGLQCLNSGGSIFFEINPVYHNEMVSMLKERGYINVELRQDIFNKNRMIKADIYG